MNHLIYIRRRLKIAVSPRAGTTPFNVLVTLQRNLESLGYQLSEDVIEVLRTFPPSELETFYHRLVKDLQTLVGAHRKFTPMYPNFPTQVMQMSEAELYFNAFRHYWTQQLPNYEGKAREPFEESTKFRLIGVGTRADFEEIVTLLARSKSPFSPQDKEDVTWFASQYRDGIYELLPLSVPCKENLALLGATLIRHTSDAAPFLHQHLKTATDVLRLAIAMSDGDVSLATACKFGKFRRRERKLLLDCIERNSARTEDMLRWKQRWIRLGERLHPGEFAHRFPLTQAAFDVLRNNRPFDTLNRQVERELNARNVDRVLALLSPRPGELARRLDHLSRIGADPQLVIDEFAESAAKISTPVLLQVMTHFSYRNEPADLRVFFPKGDVGNLFATAKSLPQMSPAVCQQLASTCRHTLGQRFAKLAPLGSCYLDPKLTNYLVPFSQRSASKSLRTLVRGSRLRLPDCSTLRFFVWWKNGRSRVDIDLSAAMYDAQYGYIDTLAYYNLKNFGAHHSGDIVDAPKGAAEFIDIDVLKCRAQRVRYVVMCLTSYTEQPYCELPECFAGWMARRQPNSGEVFDPRTVVDKVDLAANTHICLPAIFDLQSGEVCWADIALRKYPRFPNNVHNNLGGVSLMLRAMTHLRKTDLHTLFDLHIQSRGKSVDAPNGADTVFAVDRGITPYDLDRIAAEFM